MTSKIFQSVPRQDIFIAAFFLALALTSCSTATKSTAKNQTEAKQASAKQSYTINEDMSCDEHIAAAKRAHDIAAIFDAQYDEAKSKQREMVSSAQGYIFFEQDQAELNEIKKEMAAYKEQSQKFTTIARNHESAVQSLSAEQIGACLM